MYEVRYLALVIISITHLLFVPILIVDWEPNHLDYIVKSIENRRTNLIESNMIFFWVWESGQAHYWNDKKYHDICPSGYALVHPTAYRWQVQSVALRLYAAKPNLDIYVSLVYGFTHNKAQNRGTRSFNFTPNWLESTHFRILIQNVKNWVILINETE